MNISNENDELEKKFTQLMELTSSRSTDLKNISKIFLENNFSNLINIVREFFKYTTWPILIEKKYGKVAAIIYIFEKINIISRNEFDKLDNVSLKNFLFSEKIKILPQKINYLYDEISKLDNVHDQIIKKIPNMSVMDVYRCAESIQLNEKQYRAEKSRHLLIKLELLYNLFDLTQPSTLDEITKETWGVKTMNYSDNYNNNYEKNQRNLKKIKPKQEPTDECKQMQEKTLLYIITTIRTIFEEHKAQKNLRKIEIQFCDLTLTNISQKLIKNIQFINPIYHKDYRGEFPNIMVKYDVVIRLTYNEFQSCWTKNYSSFYFSDIAYLNSIISVQFHDYKNNQSICRYCKICKYLINCCSRKHSHPFDTKCGHAKCEHSRCECNFSTRNSCPAKILPNTIYTGYNNPDIYSTDEEEYVPKDSNIPFSTGDHFSSDDE